MIFELRSVSIASIFNLPDGKYFSRDPDRNLSIGNTVDCANPLGEVRNGEVVVTESFLHLRRIFSANDRSVSRKMEGILVHYRLVSVFRVAFRREISEKSGRAYPYI